MARGTDVVGKAMGKLKGVRQEVTGGTGIFARLSTEHGEISTMIRRVAASGKHSNVRGELYPEIRRQLLAHAHAEEKEVYSVFRNVPELSGRMDHSADEHHEIERLLGELDAMKMTDDRWIETFRHLMGKVQKHVMEEEMQIFPVAKDAFGEQRSKALERTYLAAKESELHAAI